MNEKLSSEQWTKFWEKGTPTTFFGSFDKNYDGKIAEFWNTQFEKLSEDAQVLDLATGNGALSVLAAGYSVKSGKALSVTGIDYADIDPSGLVLGELAPLIRDKMEFHPFKSMENTGLAGDTFDLAISQFGFEYGEPRAAVQEASRVMKRESRLALLMHKKGSVIHRQSNDGIKEVEYCYESGLHALLSELIRRLDTVQTNGNDPAEDSEATDLREEINRVTGKLHDQMEAFKDPRHISYFLTNSMVMFRPQFANHSLADKLDLLRLVREETDAYALRMKDLQSAVRTNDDIRHLEQLLGAEGFEIIESEPLRVDEGVFCHRFVAERHSA